MVRIMPLTIALCLFGALTPALGQDDVGEAARVMTVISKVSYSERSRTTTRYCYLLQQFMALCSDVHKAMKAADMLVVVHQEISETGLEERLPALTETLHSMTQDIAPHARVAKSPLKCSEVWAMYTILRLKGKGTEGARRGVTEVANGLYRLGTRK